MCFPTGVLGVFGSEAISEQSDYLFSLQAGVPHELFVRGHARIDAGPGHLTWKSVIDCPVLVDERV